MRLRSKLRLAATVPLLVGLWLVASPQAKDDKAALKPLHRMHAQNELECTVCHEQAQSSTSGNDLLLPTKAICSTCHDVEDTSQCGVCHGQAESPRGYAPRVAVAQNFPHELHVQRGLDCATCHLDAALEEPILPDKTICRDCHATASQQSDCRLCHAPGEELVPVSHGPQFMQVHGIQAAWNQARCDVCHTQTDCQECHGGDNVRPRTHPLNYFYAHVMEARSKEQSCSSCHESAFCSGCHKGQRVLPSNHSGTGWLTTTGGRHAEEGRFDMESCAACHDAGGSAPTCARCHGR